MSDSTVRVTLSDLQTQLIRIQLLTTELTHLMNLFIRSERDGHVPASVEIPEEYLSMNIGTAENKPEYAGGC